MAKKLGVYFKLGLVLLIIGGCTGGSYTVTYGDIHSSQNELSGKYDRFSGFYFKKVEIEDGETLTVTFTADTEKGHLIAKVINSDRYTVKTLNSGDKVSFHQAGQYKLQVEGKKHRGNFTLNWKRE